MLNGVLAGFVVLLVVPHVPQVFEALDALPPRICLVDLSNNPRTASLFSRGVLEEHGSVNTFSVVTPTEGCHASSERLLLVAHTQQMDWCLGREICIVTGDEQCRSPTAALQSLHMFLLRAQLFAVVPEVAAEGQLSEPPRLADADADDYFDELWDQEAEALVLPRPASSPYSTLERQRLALVEGLELLRPNVILREFYSSKYTTPAVALGPRFEFLRVDPHERDAGNRKCVRACRFSPLLRSRRTWVELCCTV
jgi:hypothetical protein